VNWNSYNAFMDSLGRGGRLSPVVAGLVVLMVFALVMRRRSRS
jgi:MYXO-CTERM domain-containing protein